MAADEPGGRDARPARDPETVREAMAAAMRSSAIGKAAQQEELTGRDLLAAMGGARGIADSVLPGLVFLVVYTITQQVAPSVLAPLGIAAVMLVVRLLRREPVTPAIAGFVGIGISAAFALWTGRAGDNFVPGFLINGAVLAIMLLSIAVRRPFIGIVLGFVSGDPAWRRHPRKLRVAYVATGLWAAVMALRLAVQFPLYLLSVSDGGEGFTSALSATKLVMGVPLYAALLWVTWLLVRRVWFPPRSEAAG